MALEKGTLLLPDGSPELESKSASPHIGVHVTADVCVTRFNYSLSSDDSENPTVTIVTSLNAVFKEPSTTENGHTPDKISKTSLTTTKPDPFYLEETLDQPIVRRSKKNTQINESKNLEQFLKTRNSQIDRTVILPYLGCTIKQELLQFSLKDNMLVKASKSWETITKSSNKIGKAKHIRSRSLNEHSFKNNSNKNQGAGHNFSKLKASSPSSSVELEFSNTNKVKPFLRRFYYKMNSDSQMLHDGEGNRKFQSTLNTNEMNAKTTDLPQIFHNKDALNKNLSGFEHEISPTTEYVCLKSTRNVSILHRPRTKNQATSTSSLNNLQQHLDDSIKGLVMPYIAAGKDFPSELVLKLIPKKEVIENNQSKENPKKDELNGSACSSEINLLTPVITTSPEKKQKKRGIFKKCFSKSKKKENGSNESFSKEVYYPSIVEVHSKKPKEDFIDEGSDTYTLNSSVHDRKKKKTF